MTFEYNPNSYEEWKEKEAAQREIDSGDLGATLEEEDLGFWGTVGDVAMAPVRGVAGAIEGIGEIGNIVGLDYDIPENLGLGGSETFGGAAIETLVQFGAGFAAPGIGGLSVMSKVGKLSRIGKMVDAGNKAVVAHQKANRYVPAMLIARGMEAGKYAAAGAYADFTVFDGHEQRLSNLIQEIPGLENPITEFLAADEEDSELVGRLKAALEGAGLGVMVDGVLLGVRAIRAGAKAGPDKKAASIALAKRQKELLAEQAEETVEKTTDDVVGTPANKTDEEVVETPKVVDEAVEETTPKTAKELADELLNLENNGGTQKMLAEAVEARVKELSQHIDDDLAESTARVKDSSSPYYRETAEIYDEETAAAATRMRQESLENAEFLDEAAGTNLTELERALKIAGQTTEEARNAATKFRFEVGATRELLKKVGEDALALVKNNLEITPKTMAKFILMQKQHKTLSNQIRATQSEWGRTLQSANRGTGDTTAGAVMRNIPEEDALQKFSMADLDDEGMVKAIIDMQGGESVVMAEIKRFKATVDSSGLAAGLKYQRGKAGFSGALTEWWMNSILSGPTTLIVNGVSGFATTILAPLEKSAGFAMTGDFTNAGVEFGRLLNLPSEIGNAFEAARTAWRTGEGQLEKIGSKMDERAASGGQIERFIDELDFDNDSWGVFASKWIARNAVNQPGKLLLGTDEFFKQLNYRTTMRAELYKEALNQNPPMSASMINAYVDKQYTRLVDDGQKLTTKRFYDEAQKLFPDKEAPDYIENVDKYIRKNMRQYSPMAERALAAAREATFTTPLSKERGMLSHLGKTTSDAVIAYPALRLVLPFVRTPTNIIQHVLDRVPLVGRGQFNEVQKVLKKIGGEDAKLLSSADKEVRAEAFGRLAAGMTFFGGATVAAMNGGITGSGPKDLKQRKIKEQTGWRPYSIKVGDSYISYRRLDPVASFLGIAADIVDIMDQGDEEQRQDAVDASLAAMMAISKNLSSKTYLKGIQDVSGLLFNPEMTVPRFVERTIASMIVPNVSAQFARAGQGELTDVKGLTDAIYARVPGLSASVPPRRNMLGEPILNNGVNVAVDLINPFAYSTVKDDKMMTEFDQIGHGFSAPRSFKNGVELRDYKNRKGQSAYDRWLELSGETRINGKTVKQELNKLMNSSKYKQLPYEAIDGLDKSPRARLIQSILNKYRSKAFNSMLREFPEVGERNKINNMIKGRRKAGRDYNDLLALIEE